MTDLVQQERHETRGDDGVTDHDVPVGYVIGERDGKVISRKSMIVAITVSRK
jgi:hypothetical protein